MFATPRPVTLTELRPDAATGRYSATKPGNGETRVDTKAAISRIKADKERDAEKSAAARKIMEENAGEIKVMQAGNPQPKRFNGYYKRKRLAAQKAASSTLTGWTSSFNQGDVFGFAVVSATSITRLYLSLTTLRS